MISHNAAEIARRMERRAATVALRSRDAARALAPELEAEAKRIIREEIYGVPIPEAKGQIKGRGGKPPRQWERTGALLNGERAVARGVTIVLTNNARHASPRHRLGTANGRRIRSEGIKSVQWRPKAILNLRPRITQVRRQGVVDGLRRP